MKWLSPVSDGCVVTVKVVPRASKTEIAAEEEEWLRIRLQAPPVDGKANAALIVFFATLFSCPKSSVEVVSGATARVKRIHVRGVSPARAKEALQGNA